MRRKYRRTSIQFYRLAVKRGTTKRIGLFLIVISLCTIYAPRTNAAGYDAEQLYEIQTGTGHYDPAATACSNTGGGSGSTPVAASNDHQKVAYEFFMANGFSSNAAAAIVGNFMQESTTALDPTIVNNIGATGIAQWLGTRLTQMRAWVASKNGNPSTLGGQQGQPVGQLDFVIQELNTGYTSVRDYMKSHDNLSDDVHEWNMFYEASGSPDAPRLTYAQQVLTAFGGGGGNSGGSSGGGGPNNNCGSSGTVNATGCANPFSAAKDKLSPERIDMGVDYAAPAGTPIYAMCDGTVTAEAAGGTGWVSPTNTQACVVIQFTGGPYATNKFNYYVCEDIAPVVHTGETVKAGQEIATFLPSPTGLETGWASGPTYNPLAAQLNQECTNGDPGCQSTAAGVSFNKFLVATGCKSGDPLVGTAYKSQTMPPGYP